MTTRRSFRRIALLMFVLGAGLGASHAQIASSGADKHSIISARGAALGDSYGTDPLDASSMYVNPASLVRIRRQSLILNGAFEKNEYDDEIITGNVTFPLPVVRDWGLGIGLTLTHSGKLSDDSPFFPYTFSLFKADVVGARTLGNALSLGIGAAMWYGQGGGVNYTTFSSSLGILYAPNPVVSYGASIQGLGEGIEFRTDPDQTSITRIVLDRSVELGMTVRNPNKDLSFFALTASGQKILKQTGVIYKGGIEATTFPFLVLRIGYWIGPGSQAARYGFGLVLGDFLLDYVLAPSKLEPRYQQVSISYNLQSKTSAR